MRTTYGQPWLRGWRSLLIAAVLVAGAQLLGSSALSAHDMPARTGTVTGQVTDARSAEGLAGALVEVEGTVLAATTGEDGRYRIANVPAGPRVIVVRHLGYSAVRQAVTVVDDQQVTVDFALQASAIALDQIVVTGIAGGALRRSIGNSVSTIAAVQAMERSAAPTLTSLLNARAPGVIISPGTNRVGAGPTIQIRGRSTLSLSSEPIVYIDGVRINNSVNQGPSGAAGGLSFGAQNSQVASRLNDINPEDIESIEVIKGPAAATIYGTEAANGVIQIITRRGSSGAAVWTAKIEQGALWFADAEGRIPTNYARDPQTGQPVPWNPIQQEKDRGTPIFHTGRTQSYTLGVSGGAELISYYLSGTYTDDEGIEPNNSGKNFSGRANLNITLSEKADISTSMQYHRSSAHLGADGGLSPMLSMAIGHALLFPANRGFAFAPPELPQQIYDNAQDINRFTGGVTFNHRPVNWLAHRLLVGLDYTSDDSRGLERFAPPEIRPFFTPAIGGPITGDGRIGQNLRNDTYITADYSGTATFDVTPAISSSSSVGGQFVRKQFKSSFLTGSAFPGLGVETVSGTTTQLPGSQSLTVNTTIGAYVQQQFAWEGRRFLTGALRVDNNSAFGDDFDLVTYPKLSAAWVVSEEPFWSFGNIVNTLRLRAAYGQSGQQPNTFAALQTVTNAPRANGTPGVTPGTIGNPDLKPERATELEVGFEAGLFDRLSLDLTYFTRRTKDAILSRDLAPSSGFSGNQIINIGETSNRGVELQASLQAVRLENFSWEITGNISTNRDRIEDMGGVPPGTGMLRNVEGYPIGGFWTKRIASATRDPNTHAISNILCENGPPSNGTPAPCAQAFAVFVGTPTPKVLGAIGNTFTIGRRLSLYGLFDFKRGHKILNANNVSRCGLNVCEARFFPERYSTEYLAGIAQSSITAGVLDQYIEDASFLKLREVSATYQLPENWLRYAGVSRASLVLAGRNLATWTDYSGIDPEVRYQGTTPQDQGLVPALTQFVATLNVRF